MHFDIQESRENLGTFLDAKRTPQPRRRAPHRPSLGVCDRSLGRLGVPAGASGGACRSVGGVLGACQSVGGCPGRLLGLRRGAQQRFEHMPQQFRNDSLDLFRLFGITYAGFARTREATDKLTPSSYSALLHKAGFLRTYTVE